MCTMWVFTDMVPKDFIADVFFPAYSTFSSLYGPHTMKVANFLCTILIKLLGHVRFLYVIFKIRALLLKCY